MSETDLQLLARYARNQAEDAFTELVRRHLGLVFSAALRQVRSPQLAEEIAQSVFTDLARRARELAPATTLPAWLYQVTRHTAIDVIRRESRRQLREQIACEITAMNVTEADWTRIEPLLDEAMQDLEEADRTAILLRYFENRSLREVGQVLGASDDAAQKRVSRAVERLREFFAKRGVTVGAGGLAVIISANAAQAAPAGLALTISATALGASGAATSTIIATATKTIAMTTLQKTSIAAMLALLAGAGIYEAQQNSRLREQNAALQSQTPPSLAELQSLQRERDAATNALAGWQAEFAKMRSNNLELLKLRGEVASLKARKPEPATAGADATNDPAVAMAKSWIDRVNLLKDKLNQSPAAQIPELRFLSEKDWLDVAKNYDASADPQCRQIFSSLRFVAENNVAHLMQTAMKKYTEANNGAYATDLSLLNHYMDNPLEEAILQRYVVYPGDTLQSIKLGGDWVITQKAPVDDGVDQRLAIGPNGNGSTSFAKSEIVDTLAPALKAYNAANSGRMPTDPSQLAPYITTPEQQAALQLAMKMMKEAGVK